MSNKRKVVGECRVCGVICDLSIEHILPRAAGGGEKTKIFTGDEVLKAVSRRQNATEDEDEKPYGILQQNGFTKYTLCKSCNNYSGRYYDKDFAALYNAIRYFVHQQTKDLGFTVIEEQDNFLSDKGLFLKLGKLKPHNIAKRVLVAFCSVEHAGLTNRKPEIRKAVMNKDYIPDTRDFSIYFTPHIGSNGYFGTLAALTSDGAVHSYAGIELGPLAFYLADHDAHLKGGGLSRCINITDWLTDYQLDEEAGTLEINANFEKSLALNVPSWAFE